LLESLGFVPGKILDVPLNLEKDFVDALLRDHCKRYDHEFPEHTQPAGYVACIRGPVSFPGVIAAACSGSA
jgi:hypothetical protein